MKPSASPDSDSSTLTGTYIDNRQDPLHKTCNLKGFWSFHIEHKLGKIILMADSDILCPSSSLARLGLD